MPTRHREELQQMCAGRLTITRHPDGCLLLYPRPRWEAKLVELDALVYESRALRRLMLGHAADVELDSAGRVLVPVALREDAKLKNDATLLGSGSHFELWDPVLLREREELDLAGGLPAGAAGFRF